MMRFAPSVGIAILAVASWPSVAAAQLSFERPPIRYSQTEPTGPVAVLKASIDAGSVTIASDEDHGYLAELLAELKIPVDSQTLVFSKTSLQKHRISPQTPRAIYFNDDVYVAWTPGAELIEIASTDPQLGSVFYTVDQQQDPQQPVEITRRVHRCLFCHGSTDTGRVPGLLMQSVFTDEDGHRVFPSDSIEPKASGPLLGRWGGWYVSGTQGNQRHLGNLRTDSASKVTKESLVATANVTSLEEFFDTSKYLSPHSDVVALLVLQHQVTLHNLLTSANQRTRLHMHGEKMESDATQISDEDGLFLDQIAEEVVDGLLMVDQPGWEDTIAGSSGFATEFENRGPFDSRGRSLRRLDLKQRLFQYPCSYLIYSDAFDRLPQPLLQRVYRRLHEILRGTNVVPKYSYLSREQRSAIETILVETKPAVAKAFAAIDSESEDADE